MMKKISRFSAVSAFLLILSLQIKAIGVDFSSNLGDFTPGGIRTNALAFDHTISGASEVLYVGVSNNRTLTATPTVFGCAGTLTPAGTVTSMSYGNRTDFERYTTSATNLNAAVSPNGCASVEIFRLVNPPAGTNTISVSIPSGGDYVILGAVSLTGVDSSGATAGNLFSNSGNSANPSLTVATTPNDLVLDTIAAEYNSQNIIENANQTRQWRMSADATSFFVGAGSTKASGAASVVSTGWTLQNAGNWVLGGIVAAETLTASSGSVGGRVVSADHRGLSGVLITLTEADGAIRRTTSNSFGFYNFRQVKAGQTVILQPSAKNKIFAPQILTISEDRREVDFTGN